MNAEHAFRGVDIGPAADSPEAGAFREFWGGKSEMRKFLVRPTSSQQKASDTDLDWLTESNFLLAGLTKTYFVSA